MEYKSCVDQEFNSARDLRILKNMLDDAVTKEDIIFKQKFQWFLMQPYN
jgi:hypothetical protein